jgi:hypothetical protein
MFKIFPKFTAILIFTSLVSLSGIVCPKAYSQEDSASPETPLEQYSPNVSDLVDLAFFEHTGDFVEQAGIGGQLNFFFGWRNFPLGSYGENNIAREGLLLEAVVDDFFQQLTQTEPTIRTRDLENPFNSSLNTNPEYTRN